MFRNEFQADGPEGNFLAEECILVLVARYKLSLSTWSAAQHVFGRDASTLCDIFVTTLFLMLRYYCPLIEVENMCRFKRRSTDFRAAMLKKYRSVLEEPNALLPSKFSGIGLMADGSRFKVSRPVSSTKDADIQRSFYSGHCKAHNINMLGLVCPNGIRVATTSVVGRNADPLLITEHMREKLDYLNINVLCDGIFGRTERIRPVERFIRGVPRTKEQEGMSALRIPVEWSFATFTNEYPLVNTPGKLKVFQTHPLAIFKVGFLLANFKTCFRGENASKYFNMSPPTFRSYVNFGV